MLKDFLRKFSKKYYQDESSQNLTEYKDHLFALIIAGGGGTRLWPKSVNRTPKQFLRLFKGKTLTQITYDRFLELVPKERIFCVTVSDEYKKEIIKEIPQFVPENIIVEPERRETGPAHALGAFVISKIDPDAVIVTEAADRLVSPARRYLSVLKAAAKYAYYERKLVALGVEPKYPHVGLGYIKRGKKVTTIGDVEFFVLEKFVEKPSLDLAKKYLSAGDYFWNAGEYVWRADSLLGEVKKYTPEIIENLEKTNRIISKESIQRAYKNMPKIAIDYAVSEKSSEMVVVHGDFTWTDIGDWKEVWENLQKDEHGNVIIDGDEDGGQVMNIDTSEALIHTDGRLVVVVDVDDVVIVDTKEALLVCKKSRAESVKKIVEKLKEQKLKKYL